MNRGEQGKRKCAKMVSSEVTAVKSDRADRWWRLERENKMCGKDEWVCRVVKGISRALKAINGFFENSRN